LVLVFHPGRAQRIAVTVPIRAATRLQLSRLYPAPASDPDPGAAAYDHEEWVDVALDPMQATGRACSDSVSYRQ
jgi:hypothetical protein